MGRQSLQFPLEIWNLYQRLLTNQNRTNNHTKAADKRLNVEMGVLIQHSAILVYYKLS